MPSVTQPIQTKGNAPVVLWSSAVAVLAIWAFTHSVRWALSAAILQAGLSVYLIQAHSRLRIVFGAAVFALLSIAGYYFTMRSPWRW